MQQYACRMSLEDPGEPRAPVARLLLAPLLALLCLAHAAAHAGEDRDPSIKVLLLGDTSFGERYQDRLASQGWEPVLRTRGYDYMIETFAAILDEADFTIANLETAVTDRFPSPYAGVRKYIHYADIEKTPRYLAKYGVDLVSLANNHAFDFGMPGLEQTLEVLHARDIESCGAGPDLATARRPYIKRFEVAGEPLHIAVLCMFEYREHYDKNYAFYAGPDAGGTNVIALDAIATTVAELRRAYPNLFVIAYPHWGDNYVWATETQRAHARAMIDGGVDLVLGHGAHTIQEVERHRDRWIAYSLGSFVFGRPGRYEKCGAPPYGAIAMLILTLGDNGPVKTLRLYPIFTDNRASNRSASPLRVRHSAWTSANSTAVTNRAR